MIDANGCVRDLSGIVPDIGGAVLSDAGLAKLRALDASSLPLALDGVRFGPCVAGTGKFMCIGLNYADHAKESNMPPPAEPVLFMKATSAICGPNDPAPKPRNSTKMDWEVELGIIIGTPAKLCLQRARAGLCRRLLRHQ